MLPLRNMAHVEIDFEFQKPLWCSEECNNRDYYYLGQLPYLNGTESLIYEVIETEASIKFSFGSPEYLYTFPS